MDDLIAKLESAPEGARELDAEVHCLVSGRVTHPKLPLGFTIKDYSDERRNRNVAEAPYIHKDIGPAPAYTSKPYDLTAAMGLLPEGWHMRLHGGDGDWFVELRDRDDQHPHCRLAYSWRKEDWRTHGQPTPALALTIAALKARQQEQTDG